jgi:hypothetical protein
MLRKLKWQIAGEPLAGRYNWYQGPVPGRGPAFEKHCSRRLRCVDVSGPIHSSRMGYDALSNGEHLFDVRLFLDWQYEEDWCSQLLNCLPVYMMSHLEDLYLHQHRCESFKFQITALSCELHIRIYIGGGGTAAPCWKNTLLPAGTIWL